MGQIDIDIVMHRLSQLMCGYNYEVVFGLKVFDNCNTVEQLKSRLKITYPHSSPENVPLVSMAVEDFWEEINYGFDYRGDDVAGLELSPAEEIQLKELQQSYIRYIEALIIPGTEIYSYPDDRGLPVYTVYWGFHFAIFTTQKRCVFLFGAGSD
ncbi:MAG TPA: hypothetical protein VK154_19445 [Chitinophagales bacterium]|nr:hypothetical protein [Chitinophagales bacterium]